MPALIGTRARAKRLSEWFEEARQTYHTSTPPKGFERIGSGGTRTVYLHDPSKVVYKVEHNAYGWEYSNESEYQNARRLLRACRRNDQWYGAHVRIPLVSGFRFEHTFVIAMQYIEGTLGISAQNSRAEARKELHSIGFSDMHGYNFIVDKDGTHWPIDMGSRMPNHPDWTGGDQRALQGAV